MKVTDSYVIKCLPDYRRRVMKSRREDKRSRAGVSWDGDRRLDEVSKIVTTEMSKQIDCRFKAY